MTIAEEIRMLCGRLNITMAELARRTERSPQSFSSKLHRDSFSVKELEEIAKVTGTTFKRYFELENGETI